MDKLIIIEDSPFFLKIVKNRFRKDSGVEVITAASYEEAKIVIDREGDSIVIALVDLRLPDAMDGEAVELTLRQGIPTVIFTSNFDEDTREHFLAKGVLDFILKDNPTSLEYLFRLVQRVIKNKKTEVLVVDDSSVALKLCSELLRRYQLIVHEAKSGDDAFRKLSGNPAISLMITDYQMPGMDGFALTTKAREIRSRDRLAIVGVSASGGAPLSAKFLKHGANDFISKPYLPEELYTRVAQNLEALDNIAELTRAATRDFLTGLYNRRSFFDLGNNIASARRRAKKDLAVVMIDIDHFKRINDSYGHEAGDVVLKAVAGIMENRVSRGGDFCSRLGGEEFGLILETGDPEATISFVEGIREAIEEANIAVEGETISVTASFGVAFSNQPDVDQMLNVADKALYDAKQAGRNRVCVA